MDWNDPAARAALIERIGPQVYNEAYEEHVRQTTVATIAGHPIRTIGSRFGQLWQVGGTKLAFATYEQAEDYAVKHPAE